MEPEPVLSILAAHREALEKLGVKSLVLLGSIARQEATAASDDAGFFELFRVQHYLESILGRSVDLGTQESLREYLRKPVVKEAIRAF